MDVSQLIKIGKKGETKLKIKVLRVLPSSSLWNIKKWGLMSESSTRW